MEKRNSENNGESSDVSRGYRTFKGRSQDQSGVVKVEGITLNSKQIQLLKTLSLKLPDVKGVYFNKYAPGYMTLVYRTKGNAIHIHWFELCVRILPKIMAIMAISVEDFLKIK